MGLSEGNLIADLPSDPTRYQLLSAAPSAHQQFYIWVTWSALAGVVGILTLIFFLGILSSPKARGRPFNVYVLFITFPDMFFSIACSVTCGLNAAAGHYYSERGCSFQTFYTIFAFCANAWLNAVIVRQVHTMLRSSHRRQRYKPPPVKRVCGHAAIVYCYAAFIASVTLWDTSLLHHSDGRGLACLPIEHSIGSSLFFWLCYFWLLIGIPLMYVTYVLFDVKRRGLLPPGGRTRSIAIFFARITFVFVLMWLPTMIAIYMANRMAGAWGGFIGGIWSHLQPIVSASVACLKGDIQEAVFNFVSCRCCVTDKDEDGTGKNDDVDDYNEQTRRSTGTNTIDSRWESNGARRSSVFTSFMRWNPGSTNTIVGGSPAGAAGNATKTEGKSASLPTISSSGMTSEAVVSVQEDVFMSEENDDDVIEDVMEKTGEESGESNV